MKKLFCLLLVLLPLWALAEPQFEKATLIYCDGEPVHILDCAALPDGGVLMNVRYREGGWTRLALVLSGGEGASRTTVYSSTLGDEPWARINWYLEESTVRLQLCGEPLDDDLCEVTELLYSTEDGRQLGGPYTFTAAWAELPDVTHTGDFRVEAYFGDYSGTTVRTVITHVPTNHTVEYALDGQRTWHACGDMLMSFRSGMQDGGRYWVYNVEGQAVVESAAMPATCENPVVGHAAQGEDALYLFVWSNRQDPDHRSYTVFPMAEDGAIGPAVASFTLGKGHTLGQVAACGEGFLLTDVSPWEWGEPDQCDLYYLASDGAMTLLRPGLTGDVFLLGGEDGQCRLVNLNAEGRGWCVWTYAE